MDKRHADSHLILKTIYLVAILFLLIVLLGGCATTGCDNPRNMSCMAADEIRSELK